MPEQPELADETAREEEKNDSKSFGKFGKMGKIFLLTGIVLIQAGAAYAVINIYYPKINKVASSLTSSSAVFYQFKDVVINPAGTNGRRYLIFSLAVKLDNQDAKSTLDKKKAEAKDRIMALVSQYTASELNSLKKRNKIKEKLGILIDKVIGKKSVRNLFFTKYVLQ